MKLHLNITFTVCILFPEWHQHGWTGPEPVVYMSFDCLEGLEVMEGLGPAQTELQPFDGKVVHF